MIDSSDGLSTAKNRDLVRVPEEHLLNAEDSLHGKKKVLIYGINYSPEPIGVGRYTGELGDYLSEQGYEVEVVTAIPHYPGWVPRSGYRNRYGVERLGRVRVTRCPLLVGAKMHGIWRLLAPLSFAITSAPIALWRILRSRPESVLCVEPTLLVAPVALFFAKLVGARTILHVQDLEVDAAFAVGHLTSWRLFSWLAYTYERLCLVRFDRVLTISNKMAEKILSKGVSRDRLFVVRNWVDLNHITPLETSLPYRDELGLPRNAFVVLYSGNIGPKQGLGIVIEAARLLRGTPNLVFAIAGEGPAKPSLMAESADLDNVRFLPFQPYERLGHFMSVCDLHVLPQLAIAGDLVLPSKLGSMLASGRPIVVTAQSGTELAEFLGQAATVVAPENPEILAEAIRAHLSGHNHSPEEGRLFLAAKLSHHHAMDRIRAILFSSQPNAAVTEKKPRCDW